MIVQKHMGGNAGHRPLALCYIGVKSSSLLKPLVPVSKLPLLWEVVLSRVLILVLVWSVVLVVLWFHRVLCALWCWL